MSVATCVKGRVYVKLHPDNNQAINGGMSGMFDFIISKDL